MAESQRVTSDAKGGAVPRKDGGGETLGKQNELPKLPIPPLEETMKRYLRAVEGLQSPEEHQRTKAVVEDFIQGDGKALQQKLKDYASGRASYIEDFWDEAYLSGDEPTVLALNPYFILEDDPTPSRGSQLMRAASLILASLGFIHDFRNGVLKPDTVRGTPLDMYQYTRLFGTARIPTSNGCRMEGHPDSRHLVIMRRGQFYWFDVVDSRNRPCLTERELLNNLKAIVEDADKTPKNQVAQGAIGVLSTENRKVWAGMRQILSQHETNKSCLGIVDSALFLVCLDDTAPETPSEMSSNMLCGTYKLDKGVQVGTCTNRYYDKLQIIVAANGAAGVNFEHSGVDGHTVLRFVGDVYTELILRFARSISTAATTLFQAKTSPWAKGGGGNKDAEEGEEEEDIDVTPKKLEWNLSTELRMGVRFAEMRLSDLISQNEVFALEFEHYGKSFITRHSFSPDAFVQMAFQAAHFSLYGRVESTYEPAMTKAFLHGRTEAIRSVQPESVKFVKTFCSDAPTRDKIEALRKACKAHTELTRSCSKGLGQDRVLYAMSCIAQKELKPGGTLPAFFRDQGYVRLNHTVLSTSNCGNPALRLFGFGPVVPDGFGIGYIIKDDGLSISASSKHLQTQRFLDTLRAYLIEVQRLIVQLYREANRRADLTFVDHHAGTIDSRTGRPIEPMSHARGASIDKPINGDSSSDAMMGAYGFFGDVEQVESITTERRRRRAPTVGTMLEIDDS